MRPCADVLAVRPRKDLETPVPATTPSNDAPTSFFIATEDMLGRMSWEPTVEGRESTFGVESLQETLCCVEGEEENKKCHGDGNDDDRKSDGCLKVTVRGRNSSPKNLERALRAHAKEGSSAHSSIRRTSPSASESMMSQVSPLQGLSLPSSPKSTSTHSSRPLDEESMDEATSQAIVSSEEEDEYSISGLQDSAPQLIMPSIQMPSRRPFTERGKATGRLKILIAGDSGMVPQGLARVAEMLIFSKELARRLSLNRSYKLVRILFTLIHYLQAHPPLTSYDHGDPKVADKSRSAQIPHAKSQKSMQAHGLIHLGGPKLKRAKFFANARAWENL